MKKSKIYIENANFNHCKMKSLLKQVTVPRGKIEKVRIFYIFSYLFIFLFIFIYFFFNLFFLCTGIQQRKLNDHYH